MWERPLHADCANTGYYDALFNAGLLLTEMKGIDLPVTGLPVFQFQDKDLCKDLENRFSGEHRVTSKRSVNIKKFLVVAQPIEGLLDYVNEVNDGPEEDCITDENRILVTDTGFYSPNWVSISNNQLQRQLSGKSMKPSPVLLELAGKSNIGQ